MIPLSLPGFHNKSRAIDTQCLNAADRVKRPTESSSAVKPLKFVRDFRDVFVFDTGLSSRFLKGGALAVRLAARAENVP